MMMEEGKEKGRKKKGLGRRRREGWCVKMSDTVSDGRDVVLK